jgi:hypothetical protein
MTAQDIDLREFKSDDSKALREKIDSLNIQPALKVRRFIKRENFIVR